MKLTKLKILEPRFPNKSTGIINGNSSSILNWNDIAYPSFYRAYKELTTNYWIPDEVDMKEDIKTYKLLSNKERYSYDAIIGLLATLDSPQTRFIYNVSEYITDASVHANMAIIGQQEAIHNESYSYVLASVTDLENQKRIFDFARTHPTIIKRNQPIMDAYNNFLFNKTPINLVKALVQSSILEGINFYSGFAFFYNMLRNNKMFGTGKIITFINRDEMAHSKFIGEVLRAIMGENKDVLNIDEITTYAIQSLTNAVELETEWSSEVLKGVEGIDLDEMLAFVRYRCNKTLSLLGLDKMYDGVSSSSMPWIKAYVDNFTNTKTDFFESRNASYKKVNTDNGFDEL